MKTQSFYISRTSVFLGIFILLLSNSASIAQERQVPFDSAGYMMSIDKGLEHSLQLFPGLEYFEEARLFQISDSTYSVEITRDSSHVISRSTIFWTQRDRDSAKLRITEYAVRDHPEMYQDQRGRGNLMLGVTLLSLFEWGPSLPIMLDMRDPAQITGAYLLFGGGAFLLASNLTSRMEVTPGEASFANSGGVLGLGHGALLAVMLEGSNIDAKSVTALTTLGSIGELIINYNIAKNSKMTPGTASVLTTGSAYGAVEGLGLAFLFSGEPGIQTTSALMLGSSIGGYFVGDLLARDHSYAEGDASALSLAIGIGTALPLANLLSARVTDHTTLAALSMLGGAAATAIVHQATRNTGFSNGQGLILDLGTLAGTVMGTGLAMIAKSDLQSGVLLASLGTIAGYSITFITLANSRSTSSSTHSYDRGSLDLQVNPAGIAMAFKGSTTSNQLAGVQYHF